jgi:uncharacterized protein YutE (UPF0331/DUF86 family)
MTDTLLALRKLAVLREHIARARRRRPVSIDVFLTDLDLQDATAMSLLVATQEAVDIALHIAADEGWGLAGSSAEAIEMLARHGVIPVELARALRQVVAIRNRIAHGYASVDLDRLWNELPAGLDALDRYAVAIATWLQSP